MLTRGYYHYELNNLVVSYPTRIAYVVVSLPVVIESIRIIVQDESYKFRELNVAPSFDFFFASIFSVVPNNISAYVLRKVLTDKLIWQDLAIYIHTHIYIYIVHLQCKDIYRDIHVSLVFFKWHWYIIFLYT